VLGRWALDVCGLAEGVVEAEEEVELLDALKEGALLDMDGLEAPRGLYTGGGTPTSLDRFAVAVLKPVKLVLYKMIAAKTANKEGRIE